MKRQTTEGRRRVTFKARLTPGSTVYVAGTFNDWQPGQKQLLDRDHTGDYKATLMLPKGRHEYKFVIDGTWCADPDCPTWTPNELGSLNSVIDVT